MLNSTHHNHMFTISLFFFYLAQHPCYPPDICRDGRSNPCSNYNRSNGQFSYEETS
ncbi:hypothetical protein Hanom_Chr11g01054041 [Helianthus anomalus]